VTAARAGNNLKAELADFKRRRIREEASHLFFRHGYEGTTIDAIADQLQVTKPFIYSYYGNKGEILHDIARIGITLSLEALETCLAAPGSNWDRLKSVVDRVTRIIVENQEYIVVYQREEKNLDAQQARSIRKQRALFDRQLARVLVSGQRSGEFQLDDPKLTANTIGGMMSWVALWYQPRGHWAKAEIITHVIRSVERLVARDNAAGARRQVVGGAVSHKKTSTKTKGVNP
jgi:AcrR family transcriptional regulator